MRVAVLLKQVPDTTAKISVSGGRVDESSIAKWSISPYDEYALENAIKMSESGFGDVVAITCGPARASKCLTEAAAVGADRLIHVVAESTLDSIQVQALLSAAVKSAQCEVVMCGKQAADTNSGSTGPGLASILDFSFVGAVTESTLDSIQVQALLSAAVKSAQCEVVMCGKQAADTNSGSTGPGLASILDFSFVGAVTEVSMEGGGFAATRLGPSGLEQIEVGSPCVFTFDKADTELRRPNVRGIMMAKKKPIENLSANDLEVETSNSRVSVESHSSPPEKPPGQKFVGVESIAEVVSKLREEANVI